MHFVLPLHQFALIDSSVLQFIACCFTGATLIKVLMLWLLKTTTVVKTASCSPTFLHCLPVYDTCKRFEGMKWIFSQCVLF